MNLVNKEPVTWVCPCGQINLLLENNECFSCMTPADENSAICFGDYKEIRWVSHKWEAHCDSNKKTKAIQRSPPILIHRDIPSPPVDKHSYFFIVPDKELYKSNRMHVEIIRWLNDLKIPAGDYKTWSKEYDAIKNELAKKCGQ